MMDDLPFSLEDLPPEIRDKIDDIIEKNEDLESQLDAIDALLFANRPAVKFEINSKSDPGNESGIGSDSDSGHGVVPAPDLLTLSSDSISSSRPQALGPLLRIPDPNYDVDDFISRIIVPPPPHLTGSAAIPVRQLSPSEELTFPPHSAFSAGNRPSTISASVSTIPTTRSGIFEDNVPVYLPPPPWEFGESSEKDVQGPEKNPPLGELVKAVRTGHDSRAAADAPRSLLSSVSPGEDSNANRVYVGKREPELPVRVASVPVLKSIGRQSDTAPESRTSRSSQLYAWNKVPDLGSSPKCPPEKNFSPEKSLTLPDKHRRPSEGSLWKDKQFRFWKKGKENDLGSAQISTPSRYSQTANGPSVNLRRKKWRPASEVLSGGARSGSLDPGKEVNRSLDDKEESDAEEEEEDGKSVASDDDFSSLAVMRLKNGKPTQNFKIDRRTLKAHSMLSLYDPSSDAAGLSLETKTTKSKGKLKVKTKLDPFAFFRGRIKKHPPNMRERPSSERIESWDASPSKKSELEPQRSDYLYPVPQPLSHRSSIPSPSLYASVDHCNISSSSSSSSREMRSPPPPGDISEILRIDVRDLEVGDLRPPVTFDTFRGEIQPIRWIEERTRFPVSNRWSHKTTEEMESSSSSSSNHSRHSSAVASRCSLPAYLSPFGKPDGGSTNSAILENGVQRARPSQPQRPSPEKESVNVQQNVTRVEPGRRMLPRTLILDSDSTPAIKVTTPKVVTLAPQFTKVITPTAPPFIRITTPLTTASSRTRLSIASECFNNVLPDDCMVNGSGNASRRNSSVAPVFLSVPQRRCLAPSNSNPRLLGAGHSSARLNELQEPQSRISRVPSAPSFQNHTSNPAKDDIDPVNWNGLEELLVLQTTYDDETACDRALDDMRRMLSSLETQRDGLLSARPTSYSSSPELFRVRKDSLATHSRRLVTEAKLMVSAATRSRRELTATLTLVVHTVARVFESCRLVIAVLPPRVRRTTLLGQVHEVGQAFLNTVTSANMAAGRGHDDPTMEQLMVHTTALAQALYKLVNTTKFLDNEA